MDESQRTQVADATFRDNTVLSSYVPKEMKALRGVLNTFNFCCDLCSDTDST